MENNLENKSKFFSQYWGQQCFVEPSFNDYTTALMGVDLDSLSDGYLFLTPLSKITDEDAIEVANVVFNGLQPSYAKIIGLEIMFYHFKGTKQSGIQINDKIEIDTMTTHNMIVVYQYLQSKGYALPFHDLSVDDLVGYGWVVLS